MEAPYDAQSVPDRVLKGGWGLKAAWMAGSGNCARIAYWMGS